MSALTSTPTTPTTPTPPGAPAKPAVFSIRDLRFRYGDLSEKRTRWTVDLTRFDLAEGEQALLTAGSGYGKSTLLQLIAGLLDPFEGRVEISGQDIHALHGAARDLFRGRKVGMIFQTFNLLHGFSAMENVEAALMFSDTPRSQQSARAKSLLDRLGIPGADHRRDVDRLSVGQQQRVAVARAVACGPALVLADEPTASLDPENAAGAMDLIQNTCRELNASLLCVSHDPAMRSRFGRCVAMADLARHAAPSPATSPIPA